MSASRRKVLFQHRPPRSSVIAHASAVPEEMTPEDSPWASQTEPDLEELISDNLLNQQSHSSFPSCEPGSMPISDLPYITGELLDIADILNQIRSTMLIYKVVPDQVVVQQALKTLRRMKNNVDNILTNVQSKTPASKS